MDLVGALQDLLSAGIGGSDGEMGEGIAAVEGEWGTHRASAAAAGVSPETWRRWRRGSQRPSARSRAGFETAVSRARGYGKFRRGEWAISATVVISEDRRWRTLRVGKELARRGPEGLDTVVRAARAGQWPRAGELLMGLIWARYGAGPELRFAQDADDVVLHWSGGE